jgi:hypothetical protein
MINRGLHWAHDPTYWKYSSLKFFLEGTTKDLFERALNMNALNVRIGFETLREVVALWE